MATVRAFIGVRAGAELRDAVVALLETLKPRMPDGVVRWVHPEDLHLTLKFLGNATDTQVPAVLAAVQAVAAQHGRVEIPVVGAGMFPPRGKPHALWLGLQNGDALGGLAALHAGMETHVSPLGFPAEKRPFKAHLTLGRVARDCLPAQAHGVRKAMTAWMPGPLPPLVVDQVHLMRSEPSALGAHYASLGAGMLRLDQPARAWRGPPRVG
jgi:2'-5' RNA ligase